MTAHARLIVAVGLAGAAMTGLVLAQGAGTPPQSQVPGVLFLSNGQNVEAWDAATGKGLWYSQIGGLQSPPEMFILDGKQHMLFSSGGSLYMFVLN